jgi:transposase-like protein
MKGVFIMSHRTKGSPEEKVAIIQRYLSGEISAAVASEVAGVNQESFRGWVRLYNQEGPTGLLNTGRNREYSPELKRDAVEAYLSGEGSYYSICLKFKIRAERQLRYWIKLYNSGKKLKRESGGSRMKSSRKTTLEERVQIVKDCIESGYDYGSIAKKYNVGYQQVYIWVKKYAEKGDPGLQDRRGRRKMDQEARTPEEEAKIRIAKLEHENYMLRMERDLLKKVEELERGDAFRK